MTRKYSQTAMLRHYGENKITTVFPRETIAFRAISRQLLFLGAAPKNSAEKYGVKPGNSPKTDRIPDGIGGPIAGGDNRVLLGAAAGIGSQHNGDIVRSTI